MTEKIVHDQGFSVTVTSDAMRENRIVTGSPESLYELGRKSVEEDVTAEQRLKMMRE